MTEGQVIGARRHPADVVEHAAAAGSPDYFLDWAFDQVQGSSNLRGDRVLTVRTTIDMRACSTPPRTRSRQCSANTASTYQRQAGGDWCVHRARRRRARHGRRARLRREPVQPRHRCAPPAGLVVQAVRLHDGDDERLHAEQRSSTTRRSASATGARTTSRGGYHGPITLTTALINSHQHGRGAPGPGGRARQDRRRSPTRWASPASSASRARCRSARPRSRSSTWPAPTPSSPTAATRRRPIAFTQIINSQRRRPLRPQARRAAAASGCSTTRSSPR